MKDEEKTRRHIKPPFYTQPYELMSAVCWEKDSEYRQAYYFYDKTLLEMARPESVVVRNALTELSNKKIVTRSYPSGGF